MNQPNSGGWLLLLFCALFFVKVTHIYDMSWWVVFAPFLLGAVLFFLVLVFVFLATYFERGRY